MNLPDLREFLSAEAEITVRATPNAARDRIAIEKGQVRVYVMVIAERGKANAAVAKLLANALGVSKSQLQLKRGLTARDKTFRVLE